MLFNTSTFAFFLFFVLSIYFFLSHRYQNLFLLAASYVFYAWWDYRFLALLLFSTVWDYFLGAALILAPTPARRKLLLILSLVGNLGLLGFFKYFGFFVTSAAHLLELLGFQPHLPVLHILLPAGISFYTFQSMSYVIDLYRGKIAPARSFLDFALALTFFPHLVAGPIQRADTLLRQIELPRLLTWNHFRTGLLLMLLGYFKKCAIADSLAPFVDRIFLHPERCSSFLLLLGLYFFAFQIYADFSGYTDIARGVSRLFGFELVINFNQPYFATSITDFWRRWHISLSTWLRDYLYIPLGGNRHGGLYTYRNLFITMLLGGLWHGASWTFVLWGGLHGLFLSLHKAWTSRHSSSSTQLSPPVVPVSPPLEHAA